MHHAAQRNVTKERIIEVAVRKAGLDKSCKPKRVAIPRPARRIK